VDPEGVLVSSEGIIQPGEWGEADQAEGAWYDVTEYKDAGRTTRKGNLAQIVKDPTQEVCFEINSDGTLAFYGRRAVEK
jgi:hypothetical protein